MLAMRKLMIAVLPAVVLAGCWDKAEMNELAIVSMVGADSDPETGMKTVYYQMINPLSGISVQGAPSGDQAPVYTYEASGRSFGEIHTTIYKLLPRKLFVSHYRTLIVSERMAEEGLLDAVNMIEIQSNGRTSIPMLIAGDSLAQLMKTFTPLESVPADSVSSGLNMLGRNSLLVDRKTRVNNLIERMERSEAIVMPIVKLISADSMTKSSDRISQIDANRSNLTSDGGAVIVNYRMVGKLDDEELVWYNLANGGRGRHIKQFQVNGKSVTLEMRLKRMKRSTEWREDRPVVTLDLEIEFLTNFATENMPKTYEEMKRLENGLAQIVEDEITSFYNKTKAKGWDLLRIRQAAEQNRKVRRHGADALKSAELKVNVKSRIAHTANLSQPY